MKKPQLMLMLVAVTMLASWLSFADTQSEWYSSLSSKREVTSVRVGSETWNVSDKNKPLPYRFPCGAMLNSTVGGLRLDLSGVTIVGGIYANGDIGILLSGNSTSLGRIRSVGNMLIFGYGSLIVSRVNEAGFSDSLYDGGISASKSLSICMGPSVTVIEPEGCGISGSDSVLISASAVGLHGCGGRGIFSGNRVDILGAVVAISSCGDGIEAQGRGGVVIDGSVVNIFARADGVEGYAGISITHSYVSVASIVEDVICFPLRANMVNNAEIYLDNSILKLLSKRYSTTATYKVTFGEGDYYIATDNPSSGAIGADDVFIRGGNVNICAPGEEARGVNATRFTMDSGRLEFVDKVEVRDFLKYDASAAAIYTGTVGNGTIDVSSVMANFYSQVLLDAISNAKLNNIDGMPFMGIYCSTYTQNCGTIWCDLPTYGVMCYKPVVNGGAYKGQFYSPSYSVTVSGGHDAVSPVNSSGETLKCVSHSISGAGKYDKITRSWDGVLPSYYGTGSLYTDNGGNLYFWVPETWNTGSGDTGGSGGGGVGSSELPDLLSYTPSGWSSPLVISTSSTTTTGATTFSTDDSLYVSWAFICRGADIVQSFYTQLYVDGKSVKTWEVESLKNPYYAYVDGYSLGKLEVGTHTIRVVTDVTSVVAESNETNNSYEITITVLGGSSSSGGSTAADLAFYVPEHEGWTAPLIVSSDPFATSPQTVFEQGEPICLNYGFNNAGDGLAVSNFVNRFTLSNGYYWEDSWDGSVLPENGWGWIGYNFTPRFLKDLPPGDYTLTCTLNVDGSLPESRTDNNTSSVAFRVKGPDLAVSSLSVSSEVITLSETATLRWRVTNSGDGGASASKTLVRLYDSSSGRLVARADLAHVDCIPLAASGSAEYTLTLSGKKIGVGEYNIWVFADEKGTVTELDETNNGQLIYFEVEKDHSTRSTANVDWQFTKKDKEADSFFLCASSDMKKKATTFNVGQTIYMRCCFWNAKKNSVYGKMRCSIYLNGVERLYGDVDSIEKNYYKCFTDTKHSFLQNLPAGSYTLTAVLDSENAWQETNEKNNVKTIPFTVVGKPTIASESTYRCALNVPVSWPVTIYGKATVKGLPSGLKYSGGVISGKATKVGTYTVTFSASNATGSVSKTIKIVVENPGFAVTCSAKPNGVSSPSEVTSGDTIDLFVGVKQEFSLSAEPGKVGVEKSAVSSISAKGLPSGLKLSNGVISGVPTKAGSYSATITFKNKYGWTSSFAMKFLVYALPVWASGTFEGGCGTGWDDGARVSFTVSSAGKLSGKVFRQGETWTMAASACSTYDDWDETFAFDVVLKNGKNTMDASLLVWKFADDDVGAACLSVDSWDAGLDDGIYASRTAWATGICAEALTRSNANGKSFTLDGTSLDSLASGESIKLAFGKNGSVKASANLVAGVKNGKVVFKAKSASVTLAPWRTTSTDSNGIKLTGAKLFLYFPPSGKNSTDGRFFNVDVDLADGTLDFH